MVSSKTNIAEFYAKLYEFEYEVLLAACDRDLLGKTIRDGDIEITVNERFYGGKLVTREELLEMLSIATSANLIGNKVVKLAIEAGYIDEHAVMKIGGVMHAIFVVSKI